MRICLFLVITIAICCPSLRAQQGNFDTPVRVGIFSFEPINFVDQHGGVQGLYPDLLRAIAEEENWSLQFVPGTWAQGLERLQSGEIDLVTTIAYTPERAKLMDFNHEAVVSIWGQVFFRPGTKIEKILDLEGLKVAITERDISGQNFIRILAELGVNCQILRYPTHADVFTALQNNEADAGVTPNHFGLRHSSKYGMVPSSIQFSPFSIYFATKKGHFAPLLEHIDNQLLKWKADKQSYYYQRLNYWMGGKDFETEIIPLWLLVCFGLVVLVALVSFFASMAFKDQVRKATAERRSRERDYRRLVQSVNNIILRIDIHGKIQFINRYGLEFFGFAKDEIIGRTVLETIVPEQETGGREMQPLIKKILANPDDFETVENENICKDGHRVYIQWRNQPEYDEAGKVVGLFSVGADISERMRVEAVLRAKEEKFRTLFEHVTDYALILQPRGQELLIVDLSLSACRHHGYRREELVGQPVSLIDPAFMTDVNSCREALSAGRTLKFEVTHRCKAGNTFPAEAVVRQIEVDGEPYFFSIGRDLTEQKKAEVEKRDLEKNLQQKFKMEAIGTLAGGIAHDFNNILAIIIGTGELLRRKLPQEASNLSKVENILQAANRARNLVDQVLSFSRRQEQTLRPLQVSELLADTVKLLRATIPQTVELRIVVEPGCEYLKIKGDPTLLQQVLINLCNNAVYAMHEKGTIEIVLQRVDLEAKELALIEQPETDYLQLSVADTGDGMETRQVAKIFDPFYTTKGVGQGTGMGLAVVHGIVLSHHGLIRVVSEPRKGTCFQICLPVTREEVPLEVLPPGQLLTGTERILFVDDEEALAHWAEELLIQQGFRPVCCSNSLAALELFRTDPQAFDLLITDQSMPELSGLELVAEAKKIRPDLPVILCTGFSTRVTAEIAQQQGISHFFYKPYQEDQFLKAIRDCFDQVAKNDLIPELLP